MTKTICGVDVSSEHLDASVGRDGQRHRFANAAEGIAGLAAFCRQHRVDLLVMEATGGYERKAFAHLWGEGVEVAIVNPRSVRRFAEAMGVFEKTDAIDGGVVAWYAQAKNIQPMPPASQTHQRLAALVTRLRQLTQTRVEQLNQSRLIEDPTVRQSFTDVLGVVAAHSRTIEAEILRLIEADPLWAELDKAFRTIKGVAGRTVARLMAALPEIGRISNKAAAKLAGLAPIARQSGKQIGKRHIRGGREGVRSILFVVVEIVRRHDPDFAAFHQKLNAAGKPKKVIRVALARKLLVRLNAKARDIRNAMVMAD